MIDSFAERELGTKPIKTLFLKYSFITFMGMMSQLVMVLLEGIIIGNALGANGFGAIALFMPLETLNIALGGFFGLGVSTLVGIRLGQNKVEEARKSFANGFWFSLITVMIFSMLVYLNAECVARFLGAKEGYFLEPLTKMIKIFMLFYPICVVGQMFTYVARTDERPALVSKVMIITSVIAISWLYISIYYFSLGLVGFAIYYGISIGLFFILVFYFQSSQSTLKIKMVDLIIDMHNVLEIIRIGFPTFLISASLFVYSLVFNNILTVIAEPSDVAAYGIINGYILYLLNMLCQSFQNGMAPIVAFNYGTGARKRLKEILKFSNLFSLIFIQFIVLLIFIFSKEISLIFLQGDTELANRTAIITQKIILLYGFGNLSGNLSIYYQSIEKISIAIFFGICRFIVFALPIVLIAVKMNYSIESLWYAYPISDILTGLFCMIYAYSVIREMDGETAIHNN